jgi:hypothetical protein
LLADRAKTTLSARIILTGSAKADRHRAKHRPAVFSDTYLSCKRIILSVFDTVVPHVELTSSDRCSLKGGDRREGEIDAGAQERGSA